jgi:hypothetical protein
MPDEVETKTEELAEVIEPAEGTTFVVPSESAQEIKLHAELTKELVVQQDPSPVEKDIVVIASNPEQMQTAQSNLVKHFATKIGALKIELKEANENLRIAKERKWKKGPFESQVEKVSQSIKFYEKIKVALEAGYVIIPNLEDLDIFAIRTTRKNPKANVASGGAGWVEPPNVQVTNRPALGEGRYVNADTINQNWTQEITKAGDTQKSFRRMSKAIKFDNVEFPFHLAKPQILNSTSEAMKLLAFDDIGISPNRKKRRGDPMIVGRIHDRKVGYNQKIVSFLITWFVDTKDI